MCFKITGLVKVPKPKIAKKDIVVYKTIGKKNLGWMYNLRITYDNGIIKVEKWKRGFHYYETTPFESAQFNDNNRLVITGNAFHSNKTKLSAKLMDGVASGIDKVVKMIIPKGAKYYENKEEYVSSDIIFPLLNKKKTK